MKKIISAFLVFAFCFSILGTAPKALMASIQDHSSDLASVSMMDTVPLSDSELLATEGEFWWFVAQAAASIIAASASRYLAKKIGRKLAGEGSIWYPKPVY